MEASDGGRLMSVAVTAKGNSIQFTQPRALFDSGYVNIPHPTNYLTWDISPDGQQFLIPRPEGAVAGVADAPITVILNWTQILKRQ